MGIKIIGSPFSTCTRRVLTVLNELGIEYELEIPEWASIKEPEYLRTKQPFGRVPVMIDDGFQLFESRGISRYLALKYQSANTSILIPSDVEKLGLFEQFASIEYSYYDPPISGFVSEKIFKPKYHGKETDPVKLEEHQKNINSVLDVYEKLLEGKDYLTGEYSLVDIFHLPFGYLAISAGLDITEGRPNVKRWWNNISSRPAWKKVTAS